LIKQECVGAVWPVTCTCIPNWCSINLLS